MKTEPTTQQTDTTSNNDTKPVEEGKIPVYEVTLTLGTNEIEVLTTTKQLKSYYGGDMDIEPVGYLTKGEQS